MDDSKYTMDDSKYTIDDSRKNEDKREKKVRGTKQFNNEVYRMKSSFEKPDVALIVEGEKLYTHKTVLSKKSPVFSALFSSDFKEKDQFEVKLPNKKLHHFLMFLRCTIDGYEDDLKDDNVHFIIPLAHEYQVKETLEKADNFLADQYTSKGIPKCDSRIIIEGILEAEKNGLTKTLGVLIDLASKKAFHYFSKAKGYNEIQKDTLHEISMKRWKDNIDPNTGSSLQVLFGCKSQFR